LRRINALVLGLPEEAVTWRQDRPKWRSEDELGAQILESLDWLRYEVVSGLIALSGTKPRLQAPERLGHPDRPAAEQKQSEITSDPSDIARFFGLRERR
jgi:hypothetical protein